MLFLAPAAYKIVGIIERLRHARIFKLQLCQNADISVSENSDAKAKSSSDIRTVTYLGYHPL